MNMSSRRMMMCVCAAMLGVSAAFAQTDEGLVAYWPLDGDGTDASGNGFDGMVSNGVVPTEDRLGNADGALAFPGLELERVLVADDPACQPTGELTLVAWVWADPAMEGTLNSRVIAKAGAGGARSWSLNIENAGLPATFQIAADGNTNLSATGKGVASGEWAHLAGVFRPGEASEVYLNGELSGSNNDVPDEMFSANNLPVVIGARNACGNCGWLGYIDDVAVWSRALSTDEVKSVMERGPMGLAVSPRDRLATSWGNLKRQP